MSWTRKNRLRDWETIRLDSCVRVLADKEDRDLEECHKFSCPLTKSISRTEQNWWRKVDSSGWKVGGLEFLELE